MRLAPSLALVFVFLVSFFVGACTHVSAYQRERLADPRMSVSDDSRPAEAHVHAVHEGAVGGGDAAESGCGCN